MCPIVGTNTELATASGLIKQGHTHKETRIISEFRISGGILPLVLFDAY